MDEKSLLVERGVKEFNVTLWGVGLETDGDMIFFRNKTLSFDFGSANTVVRKDGDVVFDEPTLVAYTRYGEAVVGSKALLMREVPYARYGKPIINGYVADFESYEQYVKGVVKSIIAFPRFLKSYSVIIAVPDDLQGEESAMSVRAFSDPFFEMGFKNIKFIHQSVAATKGLGLPENKYHLIVDIGYGKTRASLVKDSLVVKTKLWSSVSGKTWISDIVDHLHTEHQLRIGEVTAKHLLLSVATADEEVNDMPDPLSFGAPGVCDCRPHKVTIDNKELAKVLNPNLLLFEKELDGFIKEEIMTISEEVREGIISEGVWLIGGCSLLRGLSDRLERSLNLSIHIPADPRFVISGGL